MSSFCMPMLIVNMGGEMVYILEQRLHAQNVPLDKSKRGEQLPMRNRTPPTRAARAQFIYTLASGLWHGLWHHSSPHCSGP